MHIYIYKSQKKRINLKKNSFYNIIKHVQKFIKKQFFFFPLTLLKKNI